VNPEREKKIPEDIRRKVDAIRKKDRT